MTIAFLLLWLGLPFVIGVVIGERARAWNLLWLALSAALYVIIIYFVTMTMIGGVSDFPPSGSLRAVICVPPILSMLAGYGLLWLVRRWRAGGLRLP